MKYPLFIIMLFLCGHSCLAQANYCRYFRINIEEISNNGRNAVAINPEVVSISGDSLSNFISAHANRFEYILYNRLDSFEKYSKLYPDTAAIQTLFCSAISDNKKIKNYLAILTGQSEHSDIYSETEMMLIASRFFLCDRINESDTTIGYHICIGINGQKELNAQKDYTTLEAFCFEAIFHYYEQGRPEFVSNFIRYIQNSTAKHKNEFEDLQLLLEKVKSDCFNEMEHDEILKKSLLQFYQMNKDNISIKII